MSLLMDALKRAERARGGQQDQEEDDASGLSETQGLALDPLEFSAPSESDDELDLTAEHQATTAPGGLAEELEPGSAAAGIGAPEAEGLSLEPRQDVDDTGLFEPASSDGSTSAASPEEGGMPPFGAVDEVGEHTSATLPSVKSARASVDSYFDGTRSISMPLGMVRERVDDDTFTSEQGGFDTGRQRSAASSVLRASGAPRATNWTAMILAPLLVLTILSGAGYVYWDVLMDIFGAGRSIATEKARIASTAIRRTGPASLSEAAATGETAQPVSVTKAAVPASSAPLQPAPVGSGLVIQPVGLAVLDELGVGDQARALGAPIKRLMGRSAETGRRVLDVAYGHIPGLGIHRATLFDLLFQSAMASGAELRTGGRVTDVSNGSVSLPDGTKAGPYELMIDASGASSLLSPIKARQLSFGAIWGTVDFVEGTLPADELTQRYRRADRMIGILPVGRVPGDDKKKAALFWSLPSDGHADWLSAGLPAWKEEAVALWPGLEPFISQIEHPEQMTMARYSHGTLRKPHQSGLAFIGDAAHRGLQQPGRRRISRRDDHGELLPDVHRRRQRGHGDLQPRIVRHHQPCRSRAGHIRSQRHPVRPVAANFVLRRGRSDPAQPPGP